MEEIELDFSLRVNLSLIRGMIIDPIVYIWDRLDIHLADLELGGYVGITEIELFNIEDGESALESVCIVGDNLTLDEIRKYLEAYTKDIDCPIGFLFDCDIHAVFPETIECLQDQIEIALSNADYMKVIALAEKLMQIK